MDDYWVSRDFLRDLFEGVAIAALLSLVLFAMTGVWPPFASVESGSMEPNINTADMVIMSDTDRYVGEGEHQDTGVVTRLNGRQTGYEKFSQHGDVIVYKPNGELDRTPVLHRAQFWVSEGENWYTKANKRYIDAENCTELTNCPAPNDGFITKGDSNPDYDQATGLSKPVKPSWIESKAVERVPWIGFLGV